MSNTNDRVPSKLDEAEKIDQTIIGILDQAISACREKQRQIWGASEYLGTSQSFLKGLVLSNGEAIAAHMKELCDQSDKLTGIIQGLQGFIELLESEASNSESCKSSQHDATIEVETEECLDTGDKLITSVVAPDAVKEDIVFNIRIPGDLVSLNLLGKMLATAVV